MVYKYSPVMKSAINTVSTAVAGKMDNMTVDTTPTSGSSNLVTSGGVYTAINGKMDNKTIDTAVTEGSNNLVTSGAVYTAINSSAAGGLKGTLTLGGSIGLCTASGSGSTWFYDMSLSETTITKSGVTITGYNHNGTGTNEDFMSSLYGKSSFQMDFANWASWAGTGSGTIYLTGCIAIKLENHHTNEMYDGQNITIGISEGIMTISSKIPSSFTGYGVGGQSLIFLLKSVTVS